MLAFMDVSTLENALLLVCAAICLLLLLLLTSVSRTVKRVVAELVSREQTALNARQEELQQALAALGKRTGTLEDSLAETGQCVAKTAGSVAGLAAEFKTLGDGIEKRFELFEDTRLKVLEEGRLGDATDRARISSRVEELDGVLRGVREELKAQSERVQDLRSYLETTFQRDLKGAMRSFDNTVSSVLGEMKDELLQGVRRIEQIESAVVNRRDAQERLNEKGANQVRKLLGGEQPTVAADSDSKPDIDEAEDASLQETDGAVKFTGAPHRTDGPKRDETQDGPTGEDTPKKSVTLDEISQIVGGNDDTTT